MANLCSCDLTITPISDQWDIDTLLTALRGDDGKLSCDPIENTGNIEVKDGVITSYVITAWTPPIAWLNDVADRFPDYRFELEYLEPGIGVGGKLIVQSGVVITREQDETSTDILLRKVSMGEDVDDVVLDLLEEDPEYVERYLDEPDVSAVLLTEIVEQLRTPEAGSDLTVVDRLLKKVKSHPNYVALDTAQRN